MRLGFGANVLPGGVVLPIAADVEAKRPNAAGQLELTAPSRGGGAGGAAGEHRPHLAGQFPVGEGEGGELAAAEAFVDLVREDDGVGRHGIATSHSGAGAGRLKYWTCCSAETSVPALNSVRRQRRRPMLTPAGPGPGPPGHHRSLQ